MSEYIHKRHNVTTLLYHLVFPAKYRRAVFDEAVDKTLRDVCLELEKRYQLKFLEIGTDEDYVHFLVQSVPSYSVTKLVTLIKSITASEIFRLCPHVKKQLWGGEFWSDGYFASTVGRHGDEHTIRNYVKGQGKEYQKLHEDIGSLHFSNFPHLTALIPRPLGRGRSLTHCYITHMYNSRWLTKSKSGAIPRTSLLDKRASSTISFVRDSAYADKCNYLY